MSSLLKLEKEAQVRRAQFSKTLLDIQSRLTLSALADETLGLINPQYTRLRSAYSAVKRNPVLTASVVVGAGWLFKQALAVNGHSLHGRTKVRPLSSKPRKKRLPVKSSN